MGRLPVLAVAAVVGAIACSKPDAAAPGPETAPSTPAPAQAQTQAPAAEYLADAGAGGQRTRCVPVPFATSAPIAEASGAVVVPAAGRQPAHLLVVGDSGTSGAFVRLHAGTGAVLATGKLPLGVGATDDLEGLALLDGVYYGVTSAGMVREWKRHRDGYQLVAGPYPIGRADRGEVCRDPMATNCGPDYEGLCVGPGQDGCIGFAASRTTGALHCLVWRPAAGAKTRRVGRGRIGIGAGQVQISRKKALTGCDIEPDRDGAVWAGTNVFGASLVYRVRNWRDPAKAEVERVGPLGAGFPEATAVGPGGSLYRFSDTGGRPSLMNKYQCE